MNPKRQTRSLVAQLRRKKKDRAMRGPQQRPVPSDPGSPLGLDGRE